MNKKLKILHVEDDADVLLICRMSIELSGEFDLQQCSGGEEALVCAAGFTADVILLDVMMPDMSGDLLLQKLRELPNYHDVPAIFMTGKAHNFEREALLKAGGIEVIVKPFDPMTLSRQIMDALAAA